MSGCLMLHPSPLYTPYLLYYKAAGLAVTAGSTEVVEVGFAGSQETSPCYVGLVGATFIVTFALISCWW